MNDADKPESEQRALDALIVSALRRADRDDEAIDPDSLPPLTEAERGALAGVHVEGLLPAGEHGITEAPAPGRRQPDALATEPSPVLAFRADRRRVRRRLGVIAACVAAAVAALVGIPWAIYEYTDHQVQQLGAELNQLPQHEQQQLAEAERAVRDRHVQLVVTGPATFQGNASNVYHIETRNLNQQPAPVRLSARVLDEAEKVVYEEKDVRSPGDHRLILPRHLALTGKSQYSLEVIAQGEDEGTAPVQITEKLALAGPVYITHLVTDKPMYRPGEVVSFRSLTLERFSLKPPAQDLHLVYTLTHPSGKEEVLLTGSTRLVDRRGVEVAGLLLKSIRGVGAGEYAVGPNAPGGEYTLTVKEADNRFPPEKRSFLVNHYQTPRLNKKLEFTRKSYGPGGTVEALATVTRAEGGTAVAEQPVIATVQVDGKHYNAAGQEMADVTIPFRTDANGAVLVRFKLPAQIERGEGSLSLRCTDGGNVETIVRSIPIVLKKLQVEFYPEGGDLVAGVANRVYFEARTMLDKPADLHGKIVDGKGNVVVEDVHTFSGGDQPSYGTGLFTFTPRPGERYELKIHAPAGIDGKYPLPETKVDGVVLTAPPGVVPAKNPIRVLVTTGQKDRRLLVCVYCRGRLLEHQAVQARTGEPAAVTLKLAEAVGGVCRVTVFEEHDDRSDLVPVAERLIYRVPAERLNLAVKPNKVVYTPGERVTLDVSATDEKGERAPAIALLAVTDLSVHVLADDKTARTMPAHFYLTTEVRRPEDLERADFLLSDDPRAATALDLLLGTQGWRRFAEQEPTEFKQKHKDDAEHLLAAIGQAPVKTSNAQQVEEAAQPELQKERQAVVAQTATKRGELQTAHDAAQKRLEILRDIGKGLLTAAPALLCAGLLVFAFIYVMVNFVQAWSRGDASAAGGAAIGICVLLFLGLVGVIGVMVIVDHNASWTFSYVGAKRASMGDRAPMAKEAPMAARSAPPPPKRVADAGEQVPQRPQLPVDADQGGAPGGAPERDDGPALNPVMGDGKPLVPKENVRGVHPFADARFGEIWQAQQARAAQLQGQSPKAPAARPFTKNLQRAPAHLNAGPPLLLREYAHARLRNQGDARTDFTETLYWHPVLVLPDGKANVSFDLCDSLTTFQVTAYAHTLDGRLGAASTTLESRLPFSVEPKLPIEVTAGDIIDVPITVANDTDAERTVTLKVDVKGLTFAEPGQKEQQVKLGPKQRTRQMVRLLPAIVDGQASVRIEGRSEPFAADTVERSFRLVPAGFPVVGSISDLLTGVARHEIPLPEQWSTGTLQCRVQVYPSLLADAQSGLEAMVREPFG
jgi:hypothetical protein